MNQTVNESWVPTRESSLTKTANSLDPLLALRGLACVVVVFFHCHIARHVVVYENYDFSWLFLGHGTAAVWVFFCLSGYLMGKVFYTRRYVLDVPGVCKFFWNRALRICPLYYFSTFILILFVYPEVLKIENWGLIFRIISFTYTFPLPIIFNPEHPFNPVIWSLSTEVQFYLLVPFLYGLTKTFLTSRKKVIIGTIFILLLTVFFRFLGLMTFPFHTSLILNLDLFVCGFFLNAWFEHSPQPDFKQSSSPRKRKNSFYLKIIASLALIIFYLVISYHGYYQELWNYTPRPATMRWSIFITKTSYFLWPVITTLTTTFFIYAFETEIVKNRGYKNRKLSFQTCLENPFRTLEILGLLSYGIYLWHMPIIIKISPLIVSDDLGRIFFTKLASTLILSTALAAITYYAIELPPAQLKQFSNAPETKPINPSPSL